MPVLLHVGLHKTGTSWLQAQYLRRLDGAGLVSVVDFARTHGAFLHPDWEAFDPGAARAALAPEIARAEAARVPLVVSDEAFGGYAFRHPFLRMVAFERLAATFPGAVALATVREQAGVILSMYGEYLRYGFASPLDAFLARGRADGRSVLDWSHYDYDRLARHLGRHFGAGRVVVAPMEWMLAAPDAFVARLSAALGAALPPVPPGAAALRERPALAPQALRVLRLANKAVPQDSRWRGGRWLEGRASPNSIAHQVDRRIPRRLAQAARRRWKAQARAAVGTRYAASNRALSERIGIDLAAYGYPVHPPEAEAPEG